MARLLRVIGACALLLAPHTVAATDSIEWPDDEKSITCRMVRWALKRYDAATLESMARARGVSEATIERLRKCL